MSCLNQKRFIYNVGLVDIDIKYGVCVFKDYSAVGKTYFTRIVKKYSSEVGFVIISSKAEYNYFINSGFIDGDDIVYMFDRFDLFANDKLAEYVFSCEDKCVLIDYKFSRQFNRFYKKINIISSKIIEGGRVIIRDDVF